MTIFSFEYKDHSVEVDLVEDLDGDSDENFLDIYLDGNSDPINLGEPIYPTTLTQDEISKIVDNFI